MNEVITLSFTTVFGDLKCDLIRGLYERFLLDTFMGEF